MDNIHQDFFSSLKDKNISNPANFALTYKLRKGFFIPLWVKIVQVLSILLEIKLAYDGWADMATLKYPEYVSMWLIVTNFLFFFFWGTVIIGVPLGIWVVYINETKYSVKIVSEYLEIKEVITKYNIFIEDWNSRNSSNKVRNFEFNSQLTQYKEVYEEYIKNHIEKN